MKDIAQALINEAKADEWVDLGVVGCGGTYLATKENIMADSWYQDEDQRGDFDATQYKYWITTDDGVTPDGYDTADELAVFLENFRSNMPENFVPVFSVGVNAQARGNSHGYTTTDYANDIANEIDKKAGDQGCSGEYEWFERKLSEYKESIGFDLLFIKLDELFEVDEE